MKTTRNRKVKRGKTRRTRRKTRTVHGGGWWFSSKKNEDALEPTIRLPEVKKYLEDNELLTTLECLTKELENRTKFPPTKIHLCDAPCDSKTQPVHMDQPPTALTTYDHPYLVSKNTNGWYTSVTTYRDRFITLIKNDNLRYEYETSTNPAAYINSNNIHEEDFKKYMCGIDKLPNPSHSYSITTSDNLPHIFLLKCTSNGSNLIWQETPSSNSDRIIYNPEKPLTITFKDKEYTLTKVEQT
jgi:hypothetical protein